MYLSVGVLLAMILVAPPIVWVTWWLLADLGQKANRSHTAVHPVTIAESSLRAA